MRSMWWLATVACLAASLLPLSGAGAAEDSAVADESASSAAETSAEAAPGDPARGVEIVRYAGSDRYAMSIELAQALVDAGGGTSEWVVLASGESWTEAAMAGPLAASLDAPVVLVPPGGLQTTAARPDLTEFLRSTGVRRVVIVGDTETLPNHEPSVLFGLGMLPRNIERVHGDDPIEAAIAVAERIGTPAEFSDFGPTVIVASDRSVADAVAVGPLAATGPFPLLLTAPDALDPRIAEYVAEHEVAHVVIGGGTTAITSTVQESLEAAEITVTRLAGRDRSDTARLAADLFEQHTSGDSACADGPTRIGLAPAQQPEQALTAGPLLGRACVALRYTEPQGLSPDLHHELFLAQSRTGGAELHVFESASLLDDEALDVSKPPVRIAAWGLMADQVPAGSHAELIVSDGHGQPRIYPQATVSVPESNGEQQLPRPRWGPHGRYLAYRDPATGGVLVLDTVSDRLERVRYGGAVPRLLVDTVPSWSPDGSRLIFSGIIDDDATLSDGIGMQVGVISPRLTAELFLYDIPSGEVSRLTRNANVDIVLSWSPNGTEVAYGTTWYLWPFDTFVHSWRLSIESIDTGDIRVLPYPYLHPWGLSWSPDNNQILLTGIPDGGVGHGWPSFSSEIFVVDADGDNLQQLTPSNCESCVEPQYGNETIRPHSANGPSWSPEGDRALYWVWIRADEGLEASLQIHDFASGQGRILLSFGPDDLEGLGRVVGWASNEEFFFWSIDQCEKLFGSSQQSEPGCVARIDVNTGSTQQEFELPPRLFAGSLEHPRSVSMSPDRQHFVASYANAGLQVYSLRTRRWTTVIDTWSVAGGCIAYWTDVGIRGTCDEILDDET